MSKWIDNSFFMKWVRCGFWPTHLRRLYLRGTQHLYIGIELHEPLRTGLLPYLCRNLLTIFELAFVDVAVPIFSNQVIL